MRKQSGKRSAGKDTPDLQQAMIFEDKFGAYIYIEKHHLDRLAKVRSIFSAHV